MTIEVSLGPSSVRPAGVHRTCRQTHEIELGDFDGLTTRTPRGGASYVQTSKNEKSFKPPLTLRSMDGSCIAMQGTNARYVHPVGSGVGLAVHWCVGQRSLGVEASNKYAPPTRMVEGRERNTNTTNTPTQASRQVLAWRAGQALSCRHTLLCGGQPILVCLSARTRHPRGAYVQMSKRNHDHGYPHHTHVLVCVCCSSACLDGVVVDIPDLGRARHLEEEAAQHRISAPGRHVGSATPFLECHPRVPRKKSTTATTLRHRQRQRRQRHQ